MTPEDADRYADPMLDLDEAPALSPDDEALLARVQGRVMKAVAAESVQHHVFIPFDQGEWQAFLPGIERKVLDVSEACMSYLLRFQPGAVLPAHRHPMNEETLVLQGALHVGPVVLQAGGYHRVARDVLDADSTASEVTVIFVRGAVPKAKQLL
jgi:anti-sigma factor ChrR (cupin superfamily)